VEELILVAEPMQVLSIWPVEPHEASENRAHQMFRVGLVIRGAMEIDFPAVRHLETLRVQALQRIGYIAKSLKGDYRALAIRGCDQHIKVSGGPTDRRRVVQSPEEKPLQQDDWATEVGKFAQEDTCAMPKLLVANPVLPVDATENRYLGVV
jgi:hypothetical protein